MSKERCKRCALFKTSKANCIPREWRAPGGKSKTCILFVGEGPGREEEEQNRPFVGLTGRKLREVLKIVGVKDYAMDNVVRCRPPSNRDPSDEEAKACDVHFQKSLSVVKPKVIVMLGNIARKKFTGEATGILNAAGEYWWDKDRHCWIMPVVHPRYVCENPGYLRTFVNHIRLAWQLAEGKKIKRTEVQYTVLDSLVKVRLATETLLKAPSFSGDTESDSLSWQSSKLLCVSFSCGGEDTFVLPIRQQYSKPFWTDSAVRKEVRGLLQQILASDNHKIMQNGSYDLKVFWKANLKVKKFRFDPMLAHHLLDENAASHSLEAMVMEYFPEAGRYDRELTKYAPKKTDSFNLAPNWVLWEYAAKDAFYTYQLRSVLEKLLVEQDLLRLYTKLVMPMQRLFTKIEYRGVRVDETYLRFLDKKYEGMIDQTDLELRKLPQVQKTMQILVRKAGRKKSSKGKALVFNPGSAAHVGTLLFDVLALESIKLTKGGKGGHGKPSVDKEVLDHYAPKVPLAAKIKERRRLVKARSTYILGLLEQQDANGFVHTQYYMPGTVTGRPSSSNPNLNNIPRTPEEEGVFKSYPLRNIFVASPGRLLVQVDIQQAEIRCLAHYSKDAQLIKDCNSGEDIHKTVASTCFDVEMSKVSKEQRFDAKSVVFGNIYGRGAKSIAQQIGKTVEEAAAIQHTILEHYPGAREWIEQQKWDVIQRGYVRTATGRYRRLSLPSGLDRSRIARDPKTGLLYYCGRAKRKYPLKAVLHQKELYNFYEVLRQAVNSPIQGLASDLTYETALRIHKVFGSRVPIVLTVYDSLAYDTPKSLVDDLYEAISEQTTRPYIVFENGKPIEFRVKLLVDVEVGKRWGQLEAFS